MLAGHFWVFMILIFGVLIILMIFEHLWSVEMAVTIINPQHVRIWHIQFGELRIWIIPHNECCFPQTSDVWTFLSASAGPCFNKIGDHQSSPCNVDGYEILHQFKVVVYPSIHYRVSTIQGDAGCLPSAVNQESVKIGHIPNCKHAWIIDVQCSQIHSIENLGEHLSTILNFRLSDFYYKFMKFYFFSYYLMTLMYGPFFDIYPLVPHGNGDSPITGRFIHHP